MNNCAAELYLMAAVACLVLLSFAAGHFLGGFAEWRREQRRRTKETE